MARKHKGKLSRLSNDIKPIIRQIGKGQRNVHPEIWARWIDILGKDLSSRAVPNAWKRGKLFIAVASSAWLQELDYLKPTLLDKFAKAVGPSVVKEIRLVLDPTIPRQETQPQDDKSPNQPSRSSKPLPASMVQMIEKIADESVRSAVMNALIASWNEYTEEGS
jgi:hypothetical protein